MRRRALVFAAGALGGCGFRPLYLPQGGTDGPAAKELAAVYVPVIAERSGQLLRQALQRRIDTGSGVAKKYELIAAPALAGEGQAIQRDNSTTRIRLVGTATWSVRLLNLEHTVLVSGTSRIVDGYNIINQQFFAADQESDAAVRRIAEGLADKIVLQVAIFLRGRAEASPA